MKFLLLILVICFSFDQISPHSYNEENDLSNTRQLTGRIFEKYTPLGLRNFRNCINYTLNAQVSNVFGFLPLVIELEKKMVGVYISGMRSMEEMQKVDVVRSFAYFLKGVNGIVSIIVYIINIPTAAARIASNFLPTITSQLLDCVINGPPRSFKGISWSG